MTKINFRSDFDFILQLLDHDGRIIGWPPFDFRVRLWTDTRWRAYEAGVKDGVPYNCYEDDGRIHIVCDNHGLHVGRLHIDFTSLVPDDKYPDANKSVLTPIDTDITLTVTDSELPAAGEIEITIPWHLVHDTDVYMEIIDAVNEELDRALGPDVYDTAFDEVNKVIDNIMGMSPLEPGKPSTVTAIAAPAVTGVLQSGIMPITADPGRVYNGRKGAKVANATDEQLVVRVRRVKPGQKVSLGRAFPEGAFCGSTIEVDKDSQYDSATNSVYHNGSAERSIYILLPYSEGSSPYLTTDTEGRVVFAPSGAYCTPILDNNFHIGEILDAELTENAHVTSDKDGNEIRIAAGWAYGYTADGRRLEVQVRRRPNCKSHVRWRRIKNISQLKCGVIRARLMTHSGKRSEWAYFTFYTNDKSGNIIYKRI